MRLITNDDDPYVWSALPGKEHLFSKNISDHSIGAYRELCDGIGVSFEALPATTTRKCSANRLQGEILSIKLCDPGSQVSFSEKIQELQTENARLTQELSQWRDRATTASEFKQRAQEEVNQLTSANQRLQQEAQTNAMVAKHFINSTRKYVERVDRVLPLLENLRPGLPSR